jgi:leader peptidase (prepilin peptidase)/N-methyltransferase
MYLYCYGILYLIVFLFGAAIGSFLNVCIYRLPKEESLSRSQSHCMTCHAPILKRDLIPILSWCLLRGKCRNCGSPISPRYPLVEALNACFFVGIFAWYGILEQPLSAVLTCLLFSALLVVFFMDLDTQLINLYVVGTIGLLGVGRTVLDVFTGQDTLLSHGLGAVFAGVPLLLIAIGSGERAMGKGDGYLMLAAGFFLGAKAAVVALFLGLVVGCICGMVQKLRTGNSRFAFGPYLSIGIAASVFCGVPLANGYLQLCGF